MNNESSSFVAELFILGALIAIWRVIGFETVVVFMLLLILLNQLRGGDE